MKKITLLIGLCLFAIGCSEDSVTLPAGDPENQLPPNEIPVEGNKVLMLKVDFESNAFEGGVELDFPEADTFTISSDY